jgi:hypothetical protein
MLGLDGRDASQGYPREAAVTAGGRHDGMSVRVCLQSTLRDTGDSGQPVRPIGEGQRWTTLRSPRSRDLYRDIDGGLGRLPSWLTRGLDNRLGNRLGDVGQRGRRSHCNRRGSGQPPVR